MGHLHPNCRHPPLYPSVAQGLSLSSLCVFSLSRVSAAKIINKLVLVCMKYSFDTLKGLVHFQFDNTRLTIHMPIQ